MAIVPESPDRLEGSFLMGISKCHGARPPRLYLSPPHMSGREMKFIREAFDTNWISAVGPHINAFEEEFCRVVGANHAAALASGTAAIHLGLQLVGVGSGDEVFVSTLTFSASVNPVVYLDGQPVLIDSERSSWNMDPALLNEALEVRAKRGRLPKAVILVHLYGQSANIDPILAACSRYEVALVEDAAEALGATYKDRAPGTLGMVGAFSFNGNKIVTTSAGGMLVSNDGDLISRARKLATQARDPAPHYEHSEIGYNYRMSNVLAGIGRAQLEVLESRVAARRQTFRHYVEGLEDLPGLGFMPEAPWGRHTRWLTCITIDPTQFGADREAVRLALERENIESRPVWKPMHLQPIFAKCEAVGGSVAEDLFKRGLCLPSGSSMSRSDLDRVVGVIRSVAGHG